MSTSPEPTTDSPPRLSRALPGTPPAAPVRIVHLGLGNFHRAHQAWYTAHAGDAADWGIAAFTGRRPDAADALALAICHVWRGGATARVDAAVEAAASHAARQRLAFAQARQSRGAP